MIAFALLLAAAALPGALAKKKYGGADETYSSQPTATDTTGKMHIVSVGKIGLQFSPENTKAKVGDTVMFQFFPKNHSVVQASFENPCNTLDDGFFSGFVATTNRPDTNTFTITVKDTNPMYFYCAALNPSPHCAAGMVGAINAPSSGPKTLGAFRQAAEKTTTSTSPGPDQVRGGDGPKGGTQTGSPSASSSGGAPQSTGGAFALVVSGGAVAGLVGVVAGLLM